MPHASFSSLVSRAKQDRNCAGDADDRKPYDRSDAAAARHGHQAGRDDRHETSAERCPKPATDADTAVAQARICELLGVEAADDADRERRDDRYGENHREVDQQRVAAFEQRKERGGGVDGGDDVSCGEGPASADTIGQCAEHRRQNEADGIADQQRLQQRRSRNLKLGDGVAESEHQKEESAGGLGGCGQQHDHERLPARLQQFDEGDAGRSLAVHRLARIPRTPRP